MTERERPRRVVYLVIDGLRTDAFEQAVGSGQAPALAAIRERSSYVRDAVAVFPSITPCATSSLITGEMPDRHGIPGMCWYDRESERFVNYGQGPRLAVAEGLGEVATDMFVNLNHRHLSKDVLTLHERLDDMGLVTGSTNFMVHRGRHEPKELNPASIGKLLIKDQLPTSLPGPKEHYYADIVSGPSEACGDMLAVKSKAKRIKATDEYAACVVHDLLARDAVDMVLFYLHENDHVSHRHGTHTQVDNLIEGDRHIGHVLDALGSWDRTLDEIGFVLTADHGQTDVPDDKEHTLDLDDVFDDFERVRAKRGKDRFDEDKDLAACGNGRTGFIYLHPDKEDDLREPVVKTLLDTRGIDQVMWREDGWKVVDSTRGRLRFRRSDGGGVVDERGNRWETDGELAAVDGIVEDDLLRTPEYPLALWRIDHALDLDRIGDVVLTTRLSYEVTDLVDESHQGGGEHGSLHVQDCQVPFLSTLDDPPAHPSTVDVPRHIARHFER